MPEIYLLVDGQQTGPYTAEQVRQLQAEGKVSVQTLAWKEGMKDWVMLAKVLANTRPLSVPPPFVQPLPPLPAPVGAPAPAKAGMSGWMWVAILVPIAAFVGLFVISCLAGIALGPITNGIKKAKENASMQQDRAIELTMFSYATDHSGAYPDGKTSTEIFQKLLDDKYVSDPAIFYYSMPGKTRPTSNQLTAENVCFDVTSGIGPDSHDDVPTVFSTGYTVTYAAGASATHDISVQVPFPGMAVAYKSNAARFIASLPDGSVPGFISPGFDPGTRTYQQLKP